jgi:hypothetical protein
MLGPVLARGLAREPGDRYASMDELIAAVENAAISRRSRAPWIIGGTALAIGGVALAIHLATPADVAVSPVVDATPVPPPVQLTGLPNDMQHRAQEPFASGHAAMLRGEPDVAARSFAAAAAPFERAQAEGEDIARIQLDRALAHLQSSRRTRSPDDLAIAHELLHRTKDNEYRHPHPEPLQARAAEGLAELAGSGIDAKGRFHLVYVDQHPPGTLVETPERIICRTPCTLALPVDEATLVRFSHPGFADSMLMARPVHHLVAMLPIQPLRRLKEGETSTRMPFPPM